MFVAHTVRYVVCCVVCRVACRVVLCVVLCVVRAGSCSWSVVFPFDVVKSRQQAQATPQSFAQTARAVAASGGTRAFYRGVAPCVMRGFPANGALFLGVTSTQKLFRWWDERAAG